MPVANPLLDDAVELPRYAAIRPEHVEPALDQVLADNRAAIDALLRSEVSGWDDLVPPLEALDDRLARAWGPVSHLNAVMNSPALRAAYNACIPKRSAYYSELGQNTALYRAYAGLAEAPAAASLDATQRRLIDNALRDFRLSGVALEGAARERFRECRQRLAQLGARFEENLLDATNAWRKQVTDARALAGMPEAALAVARQSAQREDLEGWLLTLEPPCYFAVLNYADDRALRAEMYRAYTTRASDQGPHAGRWDNGPVMDEILSLRQELAGLLGYADYSEVSLATKMAADPQRVQDFLAELAARARPQAEMELAELRAFARDRHGLASLEAWDVGYYSEKLRQHRHRISQEELRPYFPADRVLAGLFDVARRLFGVEVRPLAGVEAWHPDVSVYALHDADGSCRGRFFLDLYARAHKRGGAWMDGCTSRRRTADGLQLPAANIVCNFTPPVGGRPALLTHAEVQTLFHEFGHGLHHLLTRIDYASVSGIHGVEWDAVELPSQFLENWVWEPEALALIGAHHETGEALPESLYRRMLAARNFQSALLMLRQIEFALFDLRLHRQFRPGKPGQVQAVLDGVRAEVAVLQPPPFNRFANGFAHIFAGGYASGYYSYKWAEVLSADAYARFEDEGVFSSACGRDFRREVLEVGGSRPAAESFRAFRGREPRIDALLRHHGIGQAVAAPA